MNLTGDMACAEKLLLPARKVLKKGSQVASEKYEQRVRLWNQIRENLDKFEDEICGTFLDEVDLHMRSQYDAALAALAAAFIVNSEDFPPARQFREKEIRIWQLIERYNTMEILSQDEVRNRILRRDADLLALFRDYYLEMNRYVDETLDDAEIRLTLRYYLKRRWNGNRGKMDVAIAEAVTKYDWMREILREWEKDRKQVDNTAGSSGRHYD